MITIKEMADMLGISSTTVSNVINGKTSEVSKKTEEKVRKLIRDFEYIPNMTARNLAQNQSKIIGIALKGGKDKYENMLKDPFMSEVIGAVEKSVRLKGYYMMLYISDDINNILRYVSTWNVDGLVLLGMQNDDCLKIKRKYKKPIVLIDCYLMQSIASHVNIGLEDMKGGYKITKYLIECGHRRVAFISDNCHGVDYKRFMGYRQALEEEGIAYREEDFILLRVGEAEFSGSLQEVYTLSSEYTAFVCASDYYAATVMNYLLERGKKVPEDISVTGFDDNIYSKIVRPRLTTVHQSPSSKGEIAVEKLMDMLEGKDIDEREVIMPVRLEIRESVKNLNEKVK